MHDQLETIRGALELEMALGGDFVPTEPETDDREVDEPKAAGPETDDREVDEPKAAGPTGSLFEQGTATRERFEGLIAPGSPLQSIGTLDALEAWFAATVLIPLDEIRQNPVFGVGRPDADLMIIGEAPGADEDRQGEPFVGRAGQLLNKILAAIGFERGDVYIANILKSRPPNNRDPYPAEVEAHIPVLFKQIALIQPRLILCVGKTAGNSLLGKTGSLASLRGRFHDFHGIPVMVTYHPAALLRNPQWKRATWEDVQELRSRYDELTGGSN